MTLDLSRAAWRKSSWSGANNNCVEVAGNLPRAVAVRDSKDPEGPRLVADSAEWGAFMAGVREGRFEVGAANPGV